MASKKLLPWKSLAQRLKPLLNKQITDFLIFGSAVKGKFRPNDIDVAMITIERNSELQEKTAQRLPSGVHLENYTFQELIYEPLIVSLLAEAYSVKSQKFLRESIGIKPSKMFIYHLQGFTRVKKVQFSTALSKILQSRGGERTAAGSVLIPIDKANSFEEFLDSWGLKYNTKEYLVF